MVLFLWSRGTYTVGEVSEFIGATPASVRCIVTRARRASDPRAVYVRAAPQPHDRRLEGNRHG